MNAQRLEIYYERKRDLKNMSRRYYIHLIIVPEREKRIVGREELVNIVKERTQRLMRRKKLSRILVKCLSSKDKE